MAPWFKKSAKRVVVKPREAVCSPGGECSLGVIEGVLNPCV